MSRSDRTRREVLQALALGTAGAALAPSALAGSTLPMSRGLGSKAYVNFVINVQNFRYVDESADTIVALCNMFQKHGVKGDFYVTGTMIELYKKGRTDAITALQGQGLGYHVRPPHPLFNPFDSRFESAEKGTLPTLIEQAETQRLDLSTGEFDSSAVGGFKLVKDTFGRAPVTVACPNDDSTIKQKALEYYKSQGAKAVVWYHGAQSLGDTPYSWHHDMLARPCDIVIDQWQVTGESKQELWWNRLQSGDCGTEGKPQNKLAAEISSFVGTRAPHVVSLIHDDNFTRRGADPWLNIYWTDRNKTGAKAAPYDLDATDPSSPRGSDEQKRIRQMYADLIEYAATNYNVVTMEDIAGLAGSG